MSVTIIHKKGSGIPDIDSLVSGEIAVDVVTGALYTKSNSVPPEIVEIGPSSGGGTGSSVHIGENPPADPEEGQQWMEVPTDGDATMWIYDGGKWLQQPGGKDGAAPDLTGYATEIYVDDSIAAIPPTDLSSYSTTSEADGRYYQKTETKKVVVMTEAEYNALGSKDSETVYMLT